MIWLQVVQILTETDWFKIFQLLANIAIVGTFIIYWRQLLAMQGQLKTMQDASQSQNNLMQNQLKTMQEASQSQNNLFQDQLKTMQEASQSQNILNVIDFLEQPIAQKARRTLINFAKDLKVVEDMKNPEVVSAANLACGYYDIVGILAKLKIVPLELFVVNWGVSIKKCYEAAKPLIEYYRNPDNEDYRGKNLWNNFEWLYQEVEKSPYGIKNTD